MKAVIAFENYMNKILLRVWAFILKLIPMKVKSFPSLILSKVQSLKIPKIKFNKPKFKLPKLHLNTWAKNQIGKLAQIKPEKALTGIALSSILTIGAVTIYHNTKRIYEIENSDLISRTPASILEVKEKKAYHNLTKKMISIENLKVPTLVEDMHSIQNITLDFSVTANNRFTTLYLNNHREELKNYIILHFEPILSSFVIQEEGKDVIKERIRFLLNDYLANVGVDGQIENVQILYLMGT